MLFNDLADKISPFLLEERYHKYTFPEKKIYQMYDFYVLDYLKFLVDEMPPKQHRDLDKELEDSVKDAVSVLFPALREELLNAVFYAVCAEMRHADVHRTNRDLFKDNEKHKTLYNMYLKYVLFHGKDKSEQDELQSVYNVEKPSSTIRPPQSEIGNEVTRNRSFKAANYAIARLGVSRKDFMEMALVMYMDGMWNSSYGGKAWGGICKGWLLLNRCDEISPRPTKQAPGEEHEGKKPMSVAIDHVYDLQHNTDTVFNKLKSYYGDDQRYTWIGLVLDHKANVKSYHELLQYVSGPVKSMALPVLYNRLGTTWESDVKEKSPSDDLDLSEYDQTDINYSDKNINGRFVISTRDIHPHITSGNIYKVLNYKDAQVLIMGDDKKIVKVATYYLKLLTKKSNGEELTAEVDNTPQEIETNDFDTGDTIRIIDGGDNETVVGKDGKEEKIIDNAFVTLGKEYKIVDTDMAGHKKLIYVIGDDGNKTIIVNHKNIEKVIPPIIPPVVGDKVPAKQPKDYTVGNFKVGDKVKCINNGGYTNKLTLGKVYEIINLQDVGGKPGMSFISDQGYESSAWLARFEPVTSEKKQRFKIGNVVVCVDNSGYGGLTVGKSYTINNIDSSNDEIVVKDDNGDMRDFSISLFKLSEIYNFSGETFKVGDKVECIDNNNGVFDVTIGKIYTVTRRSETIGPESLKGGKYFITIIGDNGKSTKLYAMRFKKVDENASTEPSNTFKVGDKVKCINDSGYAMLTVGKEYKVIKSSAYYISTTNDDGNIFQYPDTYFKLVGEPFKVGDTVKCKSVGPHKFITVGKTYEVTKFESQQHNDYIYINNDQDFNGAYNTNLFDKVDMVQAFNKPLQNKPSSSPLILSWDKIEYNEKLKSGQKLKCVRPDPMGNLVKYEIYTVFTDSIGNGYVDVMDSSGSPIGSIGVGGTWKASRFLKSVDGGEGSVDADTKNPLSNDSYDEVHAGDKVKCINNTGFENRITVGKIYEVEGKVMASNSTSTGGSYYIQVTTDMGNIAGYSNNRFELVEDDVEYTQNPKKVKDIAVGDKVKCIENIGMARKLLKVGEVYVVEKIYEDNGKATHINVSNVNGLFLVSRFELVNEEEDVSDEWEPIPEDYKFKVGEKVKCINDDNGSFLNNGDIYTITSNPKGDNEGYISLQNSDGKTSHGWLISRFHKQKKPTQPEQTSGIELTEDNVKKGTKIKCVNDTSFLRGGKIYTVNRVTKTGTGLFVTLEEDNSGYEYTSTRFVLADESEESKPEEPKREEKVPVKAGEKLTLKNTKVGSKVKCVDNEGKETTLKYASIYTVTEVDEEDIFGDDDFFIKVDAQKEYIMSTRFVTTADITPIKPRASKKPDNSQVAMLQKSKRPVTPRKFKVGDSVTYTSVVGDTIYGEIIKLSNYYALVKSAGSAGTSVHLDKLTKDTKI